MGRVDQLSPGIGCSARSFALAASFFSRGLFFPGTDRFFRSIASRPGTYQARHQPLLSKRSTNSSTQRLPMPTGPSANRASAVWHLALYAGAIRNHFSARVIEYCTIDTRIWQEVGFEVVQETATYWFFMARWFAERRNRIRCPLMCESVRSAGSYEVVQHGSPVESISSERITFNSACRESFWLACHLTGEGIEKLRRAASPQDSA